MIEFGPRWLLLNRRIQLPLLLHQQAQQRSVNLSMNLMHVLIRFGSFFNDFAFNSDFNHAGCVEVKDLS